MTDTMRWMQEEIERLRGELAREQEEHDRCTTFHAIAVKERNYERVLVFRRDAEIERLRGLLRECDAALGWQGHNGSCLDQSFNDYDPDCPECRLLLRVREALGE